jgi:ABA4-like protein
MSPERIFSICNLLALFGWLLLIFAARTRWGAALVSGAILPLLLAAAYSVLIITHWGETSGGFGSLAAVAALFSNQWLLLAGWIHYLAFDLFIGSWQVRDARNHRIPMLAVVPCLILTFLFGPAGLLLYFVLRVIIARSFRLDGVRDALGSGLAQ